MSEKYAQARLVSAHPPESNLVFRLQGDEVIRIGPRGFYYRGQFIEDAGEAYRLLVEFLKIELGHINVD